MNNSQIEYVLKRDDGRYLMLDAKSTAEYEIGASSTDEIRLARRSQELVMQNIADAHLPDSERWQVVPVRVTVEEVFADER